MVNITFQGPDYNEKRWPRGVIEADQVGIVVVGFDLDYSVMTVYADEDSGDNLMLARRCKLMNEDGVECGKIAWKIEPEKKLIEAMPHLNAIIGFRFGRVLVTGAGGNMAVDQDLRQKRMNIVPAYRSPDYN